MEEKSEGLALLEQGINISSTTRRFVKFYDGDVVASMRSAGFTGTDSNLAARGRVILSQPHIQEAIKEYQRLRAAEASAVAKKEEVLAFFSSTMRNEDPEFIPYIDKDGIKIEKENIPINSRIKAAEMIGKATMMFSENINVTGTLSIMDIVRKATDSELSEDDDMDAIEAEYTRSVDAKRAFIEAPVDTNPFSGATASTTVDDLI
jgi:hypothetical protein